MMPEAVMVTYKDTADIKEKLAGELDWADCVVAGPGLSKSDTAKEIVAEMIAYQPKKRKKASGASGCRRIKHHC